MSIRKVCYQVAVVVFILFGLLLMAGSCFAASLILEENQRVFDQAELLSRSERDRLEQQVEQLSKEIKMDLVLVTTNDTRKMTTAEYADQFYIDGSFGTGSKYSGALLLIDMEHRQIYVNAVGEMTRILTDQRQEKLLDAAYEEISAGNYEQTMVQFLTHVSAYVKKGVESGQYNYDQDTGKISRYKKVTIIEILLALIVSAIAAVVPCLNIKRKYAMKSERMGAAKSSLAYRSDADYAFTQQRDFCVDTKIRHRHIPRSSGGGSSPGSGSSSGRSTTHSSSGRTFSGSGKKF